MSEYYRAHPSTGELVTVYDLEECLNAIRLRNQDQKDRIRELEEENKQLKKENARDTEVSGLQEELKRLREDCNRGFPISEEEYSAIEAWEKEHDENAHGLTNDTLRMKAGGISGGRYSYHFLPTSLGISGVVRCHCGAEFEFREIG